MSKCGRCKIFEISMLDRTVVMLGITVTFIASKSYKVLFQAGRESFTHWCISCNPHNLLHTVPHTPLSCFLISKTSEDVLWLHVCYVWCLERKK